LEPGASEDIINKRHTFFHGVRTFGTISLRGETKESVPGYLDWKRIFGGRPDGLAPSTELVFPHNSHVGRFTYNNKKFNIFILRWEKTCA
jgi:hypothetical protein